MRRDAPILAEALTKSYGTTRGVVDLSFEVHAGEVFGYLGPNGAGKSTTIRTMLDFLRPTAGRIAVFGLDPRADGPAIRSRVGYVPGELGLYERLTGAEYLQDFAEFRGGLPRERIDGYAERLKLDLATRIHELSHGNKRKVALIQAFMHEPDLLVLDEPTQGLDPLGQQEFYAMIAEARARGGTVFLSSHVMPEVERICDRVAILREGRLITVDDIGDLKAKALRTIEFHFAEEVPAERFSTLPSVVTATALGDTVRLTVRGELDEVVKQAAAHTVVDVTTREPTLEDIFLNLYEDGGAS
ncbi:MAG TPA: ABC transporter ATP-binding protein [Actinomycetota bacterium]|nr:ABC transporter ATP-binding protein [Actinomycetota bacterium]